MGTLPTALVTFLVVVTECLQKKLMKEKTSFGSRLEKIQSTTVGSAWQKEQEVAGPITSVARKQRGG